MIMKLPRRFVPENLNPDDEKKISELYRSLLLRDIPAAATPLRDWILDWSELNSVLGEVSCRRYVAMTCDTKDEKAAKAYADFVENIQPVINEYDDKLNKKLSIFTAVFYNNFDNITLFQPYSHMNTE